MFRLQGSGSVVQSSKGSRMNKAHLADKDKIFIERRANWCLVLGGSSHGS